MATKLTFHVFRRNGGWRVQRAGEAEALFPTKRGAVTAAVRQARRNKGQVAIHAEDGSVVESRVYGLPKVQDPPGAVQPGRKSAARTRIARAVGKFSLEQLEHSDRGRRLKK